MLFKKFTNENASEKVTVKKEIASYLSFCSQSYFGNIFRQQTGMTPARYRKKYGKWKEPK